MSAPFCCKMTNRTILFTRVAKAGTTKTRLYDFLTPEAAAEVQKKLIALNYKVCNLASKDLVVYHSGTMLDDKYMNTVIGQNLSYKYQVGEILGDKMYNAIAEELKTSDKVVLLGSDLYGLKADDITDAFSKLDCYDVVVNPTYDGGYCLIAMKEPLKEVFDIDSYGDSSVMQKLLNQCQQYNYSVFIGRKILDIDTKEDLIMAEGGYSNVSLLGSGEYNINFLCERSNGNKEVLRINTKSQMNLPNQIEYEFETLKLLENSGVTPKPYKLCTNPSLMPYSFLTMEYLEGRALVYKTDMKIASYLLAKIHNTKVADNNLIKASNPFNLMYDECFTMANEYMSWEYADEDVVKYLRSFLASARNKIPTDYEVVEPTIINTELNSGNFIIGSSKDDSYVIDWEKALIGECEQDLGHFLAPTTTFWKTDIILSKEEIDEFLLDYSKYRSYNREKFNRYFIFNCLRGVTWCSMAFRQYSEENKLLRDNETFNKIKSYLEVDFLKYIEKFFKEN